MVDHARLKSEDDRLHAVAEAELLEDVRDVRLDGGLADVELLADLGVGQAAGDGWLLSRRCARLAPSALLAQLVEHFHGKEGVVGSSPTEGSQKSPQMASFSTWGHRLARLIWPQIPM